MYISNGLINNHNYFNDIYKKKKKQALCCAMFRVILSYAASTYHGSQKHKLLCKAVHVQ